MVDANWLMRWNHIGSTLSTAKRSHPLNSVPPPFFQSFRHLTRRVIKARDVWSFMKVAVRASESEIIFQRFAAVLLGPHVIDLKRQWERGFWKATALALIIGSPPCPFGKAA